MPKYECPECEAILKRPQAVPPGKKIKCPKCEFIFAAKALPEDDEEEETTPKKPVAATKPAKPADDDDEDGGGTYVVIKEKAEEEVAKVKFEDLRKKFPKSKRGPAMAKTVGPSNALMLLGIVNAVCMLIYLMYGLWPFIFSDDIPRGGAAREKIAIIVGSILGFCVDCLICYGASKMHTLESLGWSWASAVITIINFPVLGWAAGAYAIAALKDEAVIEGFEETKERESELKNM